MPRLQQKITVSSQNQLIGHRSPRVADQSPEHSTQKHTDTNSWTCGASTIDHHASSLQYFCSRPPVLLFEHDNRRGRVCIRKTCQTLVGWQAQSC